MKEKVSNFFITEFPENLSAKDLFETFKEYGLVLEVAIPPKRNKKGRRYGLLRFRKVDNERELTIKLDNIFIRGRKLYANIPRFNRDGRDYVNDYKVGVDTKRTTEGTYKGEDYRRDMKENNNSRRVETSYVNVVKGRVMEGQGKRNKVPEKETNIIGWCGKDKSPRFAHLQINMEEDEMKRFEKTYVWVVETAGITYNIKNALHTKGYFKIKATPMGANFCLLEEQEDGELKVMIEEDKEWVEHWFSKIHPWSPQDVDNERVTKMRCYGLPCHVGTRKCMNSSQARWVLMFAQRMKHVITK